MFKKLTALLLSILLVFTITSCSLIPETSSQETTSGYTISKDAEKYTLSGALRKTLELETNRDVVIYLNNVTAKLSKPIIKIKDAKSVTLIIEGENTLETTGEETKAIKVDGDLIIMGDGILNIKSTDTCLKSDTNLTVNSGTLNLSTSSGDGLRSDETLTINGGTISINANEGIESTQITINGGTTSITAIDDGLNASAKSETLVPLITINGGILNITMAQGDTDAIDSNGELIITGGDININAQFAFDFENKVTFTGGTVFVNGEQVTEIENSMFGGGGFGGFGGGPGGWGVPDSDNESSDDSDSFGGFKPGDQRPDGDTSEEGPGSFGGFPSGNDFPSNGEFPPNGDFPSNGEWPGGDPPTENGWSDDTQTP